MFRRIFPKKEVNFFQDLQKLKTTQTQEDRVDILLKILRRLQERKYDVNALDPATNWNAVQVFANVPELTQSYDSDEEDNDFYGKNSANLGNNFFPGVYVPPDLKVRLGVPPDPDEDEEDDDFIDAQELATVFGKRFIAQGADVNRRYENGDTPAMRAAKRNQLMLPLLVASGKVDASAVNKEGQSLFGLLLATGNTTLAKQLLQQKGPGFVDERGYTPMMVAINTPAEDMVMYLLRNFQREDLNLQQVGSDGKTAAKLALRNFYNNQELKDALKAPQQVAGRKRRCSRKRRRSSMRRPRSSRRRR